MPLKKMIAIDMNAYVALRFVRTKLRSKGVSATSAGDAIRALMRDSKEYSVQEFEEDFLPNWTDDATDKTVEELYKEEEREVKQ